MESAQWQQGDTYIAIAAEQNQENADGGREQKQPGATSRTIMHAGMFLLLLDDAVEGDKVDVRGRLVDVDVFVIGSKDAGKRKGVTSSLPSH